MLGTTQTISKAAPHDGQIQTECNHTLLSSSTVLRFSIQMASTGPSSTIQVFWFLFLAALLMHSSTQCHNTLLMQLVAAASSPAGQKYTACACRC